MKKIAWLVHNASITLWIPFYHFLQSFNPRRECFLVNISTFTNDPSLLYCLYCFVLVKSSTEGNKTIKLTLLELALHFHSLFLGKRNILRNLEEQHFWYHPHKVLLTILYFLGELLFYTCHETVCTVLLVFVNFLKWLVMLFFLYQMHQQTFGN